ncbi:lutropin-choriogonadotropic hormone receptor-like [Actinia tenebrosa]|uniref:Lutropin-choriogonadotropic hormone receptor-like n=1 Tax=Actinia tenebrosa TaxID=6105 RepID=A0A6P8HE95_ACTTE|nr:lutropin-choriogonadotropic hormone receptor-like [Actinia tenebrosa]
MSILLVYLVISSFALVVTEVPPQKCVTQYCQCIDNPDGFVTAKCKIQKPEDLKLYIRTPRNVSSLDLSSNQISRIPNGAFVGFDSLVNLSIANNAIEQISNQSFEGLTSLLKLDLKYNKLKIWHGDFKNQLPFLESVDVTGNVTWLPSHNLLELPSLQIIRGVGWSEACSNCVLVRNNSQQEKEVIENFKKGELLEGRKGDCRAIKHRFSDHLKHFATYGFFSSCFEVNTKCYSTMVETIPIHRCWNMDNYVLNLEFIIGPIALVLNLIVVIITLTTPKLFKNVAMLLVCNIAFSDLCLALYSILITSIRRIPYAQFYSIIDSVCPCLGFLWTISQANTVLTLVFLTIERYLAIIYCMAPDIRMRRTVALRCIFVTWVVAMVTAILPAVGIGVYTGNTYCVPLNPRKDIPYMYEFSIGATSACIILYLITIPLYLHIYRFVKRSSLTGVKRETSVAKRIAIMVFCNIMFFCLPVLIGLLWVSCNFTKGMDPIIKEIITGVVPTICFTLNSMINPLLYAYRNETFMYTLKGWLKDVRDIVRRRARSLSHSTTLPSPHQTSGIEE